jgi:hypothetical protein
MATPEPVVRAAVGLLNEAAAGAPGERSREWPEPG